MQKKPPPAANEQHIPALAEPVPAPLIYFEGAPTYGHNNGIVSVTLAVARMRPDGKGSVVNRPFVVADLRCNSVAAQSLRDALDKAIEMAQMPAPAKTALN